MGATVVLGEFGSAEVLVEAARKLREAGRGGLDLHSPYEIEGASEALGLKRSIVPLVVLVAGLTGAFLGYALQLYCNAIDYPINVGNRPPHAPPLFVPITFELGVLCAAFGALFSLIVLYRFPMPFHPALQCEAFRSATLDGFWISVELERGEDPGVVSQQLTRVGARSVSIVEAA